MLNYKDMPIRKLAVFNLPCFHQLYKEDQETYDIDFAQVYASLINDEPKLRRLAAKSLHEVFLMLKDEDT